MKKSNACIEYIESFLSKGLSFQLRLKNIWHLGLNRPRFYANGEEISSPHDKFIFEAFLPYLTSERFYYSGYLHIIFEYDAEGEVQARIILSADTGRYDNDIYDWVLKYHKEIYSGLTWDNDEYLLKIYFEHVESITAKIFFSHKVRVDYEFDLVFKKSKSLVPKKDLRALSSLVKKNIYEQVIEDARITRRTLKEDYKIFNYHVVWHADKAELNTGTRLKLVNYDFNITQIISNAEVVRLINSR